MSTDISILTVAPTRNTSLSSRTGLSVLFSRTDESICTAYSVKILRVYQYYLTRKAKHWLVRESNNNVVARRAKEDAYTLSEWIRVRSLIQIRIKKTQWAYEYSHNIVL